MQKKLVMLACLLTLSFISFAQTFDINTEANKQFVAVYLHGFMSWDETGEGEHMTTSINVTETEFFDSMKYFKGDGSYGDPEIGPFTNLSHYNFSDGWGYGFPEFPDRPFTGNPKPFLEYEANEGKIYDQMSDIFIKELGDFKYRV